MLNLTNFIDYSPKPPAALWRRWTTSSAPSTASRALLPSSKSHTKCLGATARRASYLSTTKRPTRQYADAVRLLRNRPELRRRCSAAMVVGRSLRLLTLSRGTGLSRLVDGVGFMSLQCVLKGRLENSDDDTDMFILIRLPDRSQHVGMREFG
jgi:hypothetical protein